jgi:hypothetical protein
MTNAYFAIGTTLAGMANVETWLTVPPHILENGPAPLLGGTLTALASGATRRDGFASHSWTLDLASRSDYDAFILNATGAHYTAQSRGVYISTIDETGHYSPFFAYISRPYPRESVRVTVGGWLRDIGVLFTNLRLQSVTKTSAYTITTADRLVYVDTTGGNVTVTLPAAATVTTNTVYSVVKTAAGNTVTLDGSGAETVDGNANKAVTALYGRLDVISNGTGWVSINA